VILAVRPGIPGNIRLGFQRAPTRVQWREIIARQDIAAMEACFDKIPVEAGQVWFVPGGMVHALGAGLLLLEVMEPSDLVVRCEFERDGILVPPDARFLGRDLDFCLDFFDYRSMDLNEVQDRCRVKSELLSQSEAHEARRKLPFSKTGCVEVWELIVKREFTWFQASYFRLVIVVCGSGEINMADHRLRVTAGSRFFVAANADAIVVHPDKGAPLTLLICQPEG
jgi:mannose-6-phosphate isomerase